MDAVLFGTSRSFAFSKCPEIHHEFEKILDRPVLNLSQPGNGIVPNQIALERYFQERNSADQIVYFADPTFFMTRKYNEGVPGIEVQPLNAQFFFLAMRAGVEESRLLEYVRSKFAWSWISDFRLDPDCSNTLPIGRPAIIERATKRRNKHLLAEGISLERTDHYVKVLGQFIETAERHGATVSIVVLPTMLNPETGKKTFLKALKPLLSGSDVAFYDFGSVMDQAKFYENIDHFNKDGVLHFAREYLRPLLDGELSVALSMDTPMEMPP